MTPPDVVVLAPEWRERTLLNAQLIEEGYNVVATDAWPIPRRFLRSGMKPRALIVDLHGLPEPRQALDEIHGVIPAERVLVVTALGTINPDDIRRLGFRVVSRPATVGEIVAATAALLRVQSLDDVRTSR